MPPAWASGIFLLAFAARLVYWLAADPPLLYEHQYHYFTNALRILAQPDPLHYVLHSDEWRLWDGHWTIAPLYHLFLAAVFALFGPELAPLRLIQCLLGAVAAVAVAAMGRELCGRWGTLAGVAVALHAYSIEIPTWTITENIAIPLFTSAMALLLRTGRTGSARSALAAGALLGAASLARSITSAFVPAGALWLFVFGAARPRWRAAVLFLAGGLGVILPWSARNYFLIGEPVPIETTVYENIWYCNNFATPEQYARQQALIYGAESNARKRELAMHFGLRGIRRHPDRFADKAWANFRHFFRPEGLHGLLTLERSDPPYRHPLVIALEDGWYLVVVGLLWAYLFTWRWDRGYVLVWGWISYYLLNHVVFFLNEVPRHRSGFVVIGAVGAAAGLAALRERSRGARFGLAVGIAFAAWIHAPYVDRARQAWAARGENRAAAARLAAGDAAGAFARAEAASVAAPRSARAVFDWAEALYRADRPAEALAAYEAARPRVIGGDNTALVALPRLLALAGREDEARRALHAAHKLSWGEDPWRLLEHAWLRLPAPRADEVVVGGDDFGAARGFLHPRGGPLEIWGPHIAFEQYLDDTRPQPPPGLHRWSRGRAWLRLRPLVESPRYRVTLWMGAPFPAPAGPRAVEVRVGGSPAARVEVGNEVAPWTFEGPAADGVVQVTLRTATWSRLGEPAEQGVRVERMRVEPIR